jgi:hypothetical protein
MGNILDQIAKSSPEELATASHQESLKAGMYLGIAAVGAAIGRNTEGVISQVSNAVAIGSGVMAWYQGSKAAVLGSQTPESQARIIDHVDSVQLSEAPAKQ